MSGRYGLLSEAGEVSFGAGEAEGAGAEDGVGGDETVGTGVVDTVEAETRFSRADRRWVVLSAEGSAKNASCSDQARVLGFRGFEGGLAAPRPRLDPRTVEATTSVEEKRMPGAKKGVSVGYRGPKGLLQANPVRVELWSVRDRSAFERAGRVRSR